MQDDAQSQTLRAILGLRGMIIDGDLRPGQRVSETVLVDRLGVSRTPARMALVRVKDEGLLEELPTGGFVVSAFTEIELFDAVEVRGTLEGMAARLAAERGVSGPLLGKMQRCVADLDRVVAGLDEAANLDDYVHLNDQFHELLVEASNSRMVARSLDRVMCLPFAAPNAFIQSSRADRIGVKEILTVSQAQHRAILDAIRNRQGTRAQALAIEHSFSAARYLKLVLEQDAAVADFPALNLVRIGRRG